MNIISTITNTPGTAGLHISSSYAKILGEKLFRTWEIIRSGSKAEDGDDTPGTAGGPGSRDRTLA